MKKYLSKILISALTVAIFLAPFSAVLKKNSAEAQAKTTIKSLTIDQNKMTDTSATFNVVLENVTEDYIDESGYWRTLSDKLNYKLYDKSFTDLNNPPVDAVGGVNEKQSGAVEIQTGTLEQPIAEQIVSFSVENLIPDTNYFLVVKLIKGNIGGQRELVTEYEALVGLPFTAGLNSADDNANTEAKITNPKLGYEIECGVSEPIGCISLVLYGIWEASAWFARLGGHFLDFFVYYSTNSSSYSNQFISSAWAGVRDIANMFFIFALVYAGLRTIVGIHAPDNKKLIGKIILVALLLNFSLFATKIVIDTSNILAKIFYNNITSVDENGKPIQNPGGQKSISVGLVQKFDPQRIVTTPEDQLANKGTFVFIIILALAVTLYTGYIFFSVALLFVARVVSLWIAMIMSPIAFASMALPFHLPGAIGKDKWLDELLKNAFLAPLFIFFLYIIVRFTGFLKDIISYKGGDADLIQHIMGVIIPFMIIVGLLQKAKNLAEEYAGEMGKRITDVGAKIAGLALGATGGAAALGLSGTLGKLSSKILGGEVGQTGMSRSELLRQTALRGGAAGALAKAQLKALNYSAGASFDVRKSALSGLLGKTGLDFEKGTGAFGVDTKTTAGGYKATVKRKSEKIEKDFELFKTTMSDDEVKAWSKKNIEDYEKKKAEALRDGKSEAQFEKENGKPPKEYGSAKELDNARQREYADQLDKTGLMYAGTRIIAEKILATEKGRAIHLGRDEFGNAKEATEEDIHNLAKGLKITAGAVGMGLATAAVTGGLGFIPGAIGGLGKSMTLSDAEKAAKHHLERVTEKEEKELGKIKKTNERKDRLEELKKEVEKENEDSRLKDIEKLENSKSGKTPQEIAELDKEIEYIKKRNFDNYTSDKLTELEIAREQLIREENRINKDLELITNEESTYKTREKIMYDERKKIADRQARLYVRIENDPNAYDANGKLTKEYKSQLDDWNDLEDEKLEEIAELQTTYQQATSTRKDRTQKLENEKKVLKKDYISNTRSKSRYEEAKKVDRDLTDLTIAQSKIPEATKVSESAKAAEVSHGAPAAHPAPAKPTAAPAPAAHGAPPAH